MKKAVILLSGGLDSITVLSMALEAGYECFALSFDYGQKHKLEIKKAQQIAIKYAVDYKLITIDPTPFQISSLVNKSIAVPKSKISNQKSTIPSTYVPARNTIFLSFALAYAETINAKDIFIGVNALDYSGYPDCRPEYIAAFEKLANLATKFGVENGGIKIHTPLINMTKQEIIATGIKYDVDYSLTISCYDPTDQKACGVCDACTLRLKGFAENGIIDPVEYVK